MTNITDLELFIEHTIVISDNSLGFCLPKIKPYLSKLDIKMINDFVKEQEDKGVNFSYDDDSKLGIIQMFEATKLIYDYYKDTEQVPRSDIKKLKNAIKICAKHIKKNDTESAFRKLLQIEHKKYFTEDDLKDYRVYFNEPFVISLKKQSSKYPVLLFSEVIRSLDSINNENYKTKDTKTSQKLQKLILDIFKLKTKKLRVEDMKEYLGDIYSYNQTMKFYFEIVKQYYKNDFLTKEDLPLSIDTGMSTFFNAHSKPLYEELCIMEETFIKVNSLIKRLEQYKIVSTENIENARKTIEEIRLECLDVIEGEAILHGLDIDEENLFYTVVEQVKKFP